MKKTKFSNSRSVNFFLYSLVLLLFTAFTSWSLQAQIGNIFPAWKEGFLDIHHINTGKGEAVFCILPDGTTMLVDAGHTQRPKPRVTDPVPDGSRMPGEWISRYILQMLKEQKDKKLDYILLTHFHSDHMGELYPGIKTSKSGAYKLSGVTEVGDNIPFKKLVDRGWPDYNWPAPMDNDNMKNYRQFLAWHIKNGATAEMFNVGENRQFVLVNKPEKYPNFEIRNIAANGHIWTGVGTNSRNHFPPLESLSPSQLPGENLNSIAFRLSYGKFDYFNGGDIIAGTPGTWQDVETPIALVTGPVDVCEANHHAYYDAMSATFLQALRPRVYIIQAWAPSHPSPSVLNRMLSNSIYPGPRDIFATNAMEETKVVIGRGMDNMKSQQGHIVIRVYPGGESYMIFILDDSEESYKIKAIHGPYSSL